MTLYKQDITRDSAAGHAGRRTMHHNHKDAVVALLAQPFGVVIPTMSCMREPCRTSAGRCWGVPVNTLYGGQGCDQ